MRRRSSFKMKSLERKKPLENQETDPVPTAPNPPPEPTFPTFSNTVYPSF